MIATARRPLLVRPTVLGAIVRAVDAAVEVGNGTSHELTRNTGLGNELVVSQPMRSSLEFPRDSHNNSQCQTTIEVIARCWPTSGLHKPDLSRD